MIIKRLFIKPIFAWHDLCVGVLIDIKKRTLCILPLPMIGVKIRLLPEASYENSNVCRGCGWVGPYWEFLEGYTKDGFWTGPNFCPECGSMDFKAYYNPPEKLTDYEIPF